MSKRVAPYRHKDGSNCWTKNCRINQPRVVKIKPERINGLSKYQTEQIGISAEVGIAEIFHVPLNTEYKTRGKEEISDVLAPQFKELFEKNHIPTPIAHIAEGGNPVDFQLAGGQTLSVKTNMRANSKISPQVIGQPTASMFWAAFPELVPQGLNLNQLPYEQQAKLFKAVALANAPKLLKKYWENMFDCDYMVYANNIIDQSDTPSQTPTLSVYKKSTPPVFDSQKLSFTKTLTTWNESNTVKYDGVTIGEWQIHNHRDCFKFRFDLKGLQKAGLL